MTQNDVIESVEDLGGHASVKRSLTGQKIVGVCAHPEKVGGVVAYDFATFVDRAKRSLDGCFNPTFVTLASATGTGYETHKRSETALNHPTQEQYHAYSHQEVFWKGRQRAL